MSPAGAVGCPDIDALHRAETASGKTCSPFGAKRIARADGGPFRLEWVQ
jgi:hypothetical protein